MTQCWRWRQIDWVCTLCGVRGSCEHREIDWPLGTVDQHIRRLAIGNDHLERSPRCHLLRGASGLRQEAVR